MAHFMVLVKRGTLRLWLASGGDDFLSRSTPTLSIFTHTTYAMFEVVNENTRHNSIQPPPPPRLLTLARIRRFLSINISTRFG